MKLVDAVAKMLLKGHEQIAKQMGGIPVSEVYQHTRHISDCKHPKDSIDLTYRVGVGDVLQPLYPCFVPDLLGGTWLHPEERYVIYQLSYEHRMYNLSTEMTPQNFKLLPKAIVLHYSVLPDSEDIDLLNIQSLFGLNDPTTLVKLMLNCKLVGNVKDQFT